MHSLLFTTVLLSAAPADRPLPPAEAPHRMALPAGFRATLFAGEPDVVQPIAMTTDARGRLWVVECLSYPDWTKEPTGRDRVLIFEDADGDDRFDKRTVFWDRGANLSGIALGFGGVWLCATPNILFIPDRDSDDRPDGPPVVKLDGFSLEIKHNAVNGLTWGPDGWLWGCHGILATAHIGKPGTPAKDRVPLNCGVWRYHPTREVFEVVAWGTTNPWGMDFDDYGEAFITNCVIDHLWHVIPGAHYERMYGQDLNPHVYGLMKSASDHRHWAGGHWTTSRGGAGTHDDAGGGHAHSGTLVYLGDNFPPEYRNSVFTCNIHGNRVNRDRLAQRGSGYAGTHAPDFLMANDPWFRGVALCAAADGGIYVADWCDTGECHNYKQVDRSNGRIYKVVYGTPKPFSGDLAKLGDGALARLQSHADDWHVRQARRLLQERAAARRIEPEAVGTLRTLLAGTDVPRRLRALWALHAIAELTDRDIDRLLGDRAEHLRAWAVRLGVERPRTATFERDLMGTAQADPSPRVRLALASALPRMPGRVQRTVAHALAGHAADGADRNLSLMLWYGVEPWVAAEPATAYALVRRSGSPLLREFVARRVASAARSPDGLREVVGWLATLDSGQQPDVLRGLLASIRGRRDVPLPQGWQDVGAKLMASPSAEVRDLAAEVAVRFGDRQAVEILRVLVEDRAAEMARRQTTLQALLSRESLDLVPLLHRLLAVPLLRGQAIRGLAAYDVPNTPALILKHYPVLSDAEKADAVATLAARPGFALALLEAVEKGIVPRRDLSAYTVRQMQALKNKVVADRLAKVWGSVRTTSGERARQAAELKQRLTPEVLAAADLPRGRRLYAQQCASCHKLFGEGGTVGPELTGSQRTTLDYVLENVLDPSAVVPSEYRVTELELKNGRILSGIVVEESSQALTVQTPTERVVVPAGDVAGRNQSPVSMMPEGLFDTLSADEVRDLVAYLASPRQVPAK